MDARIRNTILPFGKYRGHTLDRIGSDSEGLKYLDWLVGREWFKESWPEEEKAVKAFLDDPNVRRELNQLLED
jgi:hypothetical protein